MITVDATKARELLSNAVALKGEDHVETACYYVVNGCGGRPWADELPDLTLQAGCIVGVALVELVGIDKMAVLVANAFNGKGIGSLSRYLPEMLGITLADDALAVFAGAQDDQDAGRTWGDVLSRL